jgi:hypothetical protein
MGWHGIAFVWYRHMPAWYTNHTKMVSVFLAKVWEWDASLYFV